MSSQAQDKSRSMKIKTYKKLAHVHALKLVQARCHNDSKKFLKFKLQHTRHIITGIIQQQTYQNKKTAILQKPAHAHMHTHTHTNTRK